MLPFYFLVGTYAKESWSLSQKQQSSANEIENLDFVDIPWCRRNANSGKENNTTKNWFIIYDFWQFLYANQIVSRKIMKMRRNLIFFLVVLSGEQYKLNFFHLTDMFILFTYRLAKKNFFLSYLKTVQTWNA